MEWKIATGTSLAAANSANVAVFRNLAASGFAIDLDGDGGRAALNGFQIVARDAVPKLSPIICVNFQNGQDDSNGVQTDEVAGVIPMGGKHWNNITCRVGGAGQPDRMVQRSFDLKDDTGRMSAATLVSTLDADDGYSATANVSNPEFTGDRGMMMSHVAYDVANTDGRLAVTGLSGDYTGHGYDLYVMFERNSWHLFEYTVTPAGDPPVVVVGQDGENGNQFVFDGTWVEATGTSFANANLSNFAKFERLRAASFTIDLRNDVAQANGVAVSGIQIVARATSGTIFIIR